MNCRQVEPLLSALLEGVASERDGRRVVRHLEGCPVCRRRQEEFASVGAELKRLAELAPPPHLARCAVERWSAEAVVPGRAVPHPRFPGAVWLASRGAGMTAAAALAVLALALTRYGHQPNTNQPVPQIVHLLPGAGQNAAHQPAGMRAPRGAAANQPSTPSPLAPERCRSTGLRAVTQTAFDMFAPVLPAPRSHPFPGGTLPAVLQMPTDTVAPKVGDLDWLNGPDSVKNQQPWAPVTKDEWDRIEERVRQHVHVRDDFVQIAFPRIAGTSERAVVAAVEQYKREAAIIDARLFQEVTLSFKGAALSEVCEHLRVNTGLSLSAGPSVADEKVTIFCEKLPLRDVMRQLSRPFGYTWLRSGSGAHEAGGAQYRYELVQDLRSQLAEQELRNQDRNAAMLALEREVGRYRPYLRLSPDEALERVKTAAPGERKLLEQLSGIGWGPLQMYVRLSPQEQAALRAGEELRFTGEPGAGDRALPDDVARGVLQSLRHLKIRRMANGHLGLTTDPEGPEVRPLTAVPEARAMVTLKIRQEELGQFSLAGESGFFAKSQPGPGPADTANSGDNGPLAVGMSPAVRQPDNRSVNAGLAGDTVLQARVTVSPEHGAPVAPNGAAPDRGLPSTGRPAAAEAQVTTADVLEAVHRAAGLPIVADYYTRLYPRASVSVQNRSLFDALNRVGDSMRMRWRKDGSWLQFRSTSYYDDRLKEVPNRLLNRWADSRRQNGQLSLDELVEIAQLPDAQLDGAEMADGAKELFGLTEWDLPRNWALRRHLRYLASFTPDQRKEATSPTGLSFPRMSLAQQQRFLSYALDPHATPLQSIAELDGAVLRVDYTQPGWFEWKVPAAGADWLQWVVPVGPDRRAPRPPVRERTRPAALSAALRTKPAVRDAMLQAARHLKPQFTASDMLPQETQIIPTELNLTFLYIPCASHARPIWWFSRDNQSSNGTWPPAAP